ncbi:hypothetical protein BC936DRAFT_138603 [Jimgerdemannia flammicorona]|uniref:Uncharacterized protein n=2 Tax=Jimgerdemannia flammicorona TaxID=994334 RepID=A0A433QNZ3_9FUNG|nr:hypothetical protein BC936DRAFT_138603 [Jimgerdemannia flammicorona]RUS31494.1 hypothetical protein BC938DRAFT_477705 [Jimgerdemannia flammicorona]
MCLASNRHGSATTLDEFTHRLIDPINEFGRKVSPYNVEHLTLDTQRHRTFFARGIQNKYVGSQVRCHDDDGVAEINLTALRVSDVTIVENLEEEVGDCHGYNGEERILKHEFGKQYAPSRCAFSISSSKTTE